MVPEARWQRTSEEARESDLTSRGFEQVHAANDVGDALVEIIDRHGKLVGPVSQSVAQQQVAALRLRILHLLSAKPILEALDARIDAHPPADAVVERQREIPARARISQFGDRDFA